MDQRQTKIVEGAGLEESRLNTDFIDFLRRWGSHILLVVAGVFAAYSALGWWQRSQAKALDAAYAEFSAAQFAGSPDNLLRVAREHANRGAVRELATIAAADAYLNAGWSGVAPGGDANTEEDQLTEDEKKENYTRAKELYAEVAQRVAGNDDMTLHYLNARFGLAAATASLGQIDEAKGVLKELASNARAKGYGSLAETAEQKVSMLEDASNLPPLYSADQVKIAERPVVDEADLTFDANPPVDPFSGAEGPSAPEPEAPAGDGAGASEPQ